jgi:class 3 adenylate cyclase
MEWQCPCWPTPLGEAPEVLRLEKIKTIGDAFMVAGGLPEPRPDHAAAVAELALTAMAKLGGQLAAAAAYHAWEQGWI